MPTSAQRHVSSFSLKVDGRAIDPKWADAVLEVRAKGTLGLPGSASIRLADAKGDQVDSQPFEIGKELEISFGQLSDNTPKKVFVGQVVAVEPEFTTDGCVIGVRALEYSHKLHRNRKQRSFLQMTLREMFTKVVKEAGLRPGRVDSTAPAYKYFQQANETDWQFLSRLGVDHDLEVVAEGQHLHFRKMHEGQGAELRLKWPEALLSFRPRVSGVQQSKRVNVRGWDPVNKAAITGQASSANGHNRAGIARPNVLTGIGGNAEILIADRTVESSGAANTLAKSTLDRIADSYVEAEGRAYGKPDLWAGSKVKIEGVGRKFGGSFVVTTAEHVYRSNGGYNTNFAITGRSHRTLLDLMRPPEQREWTHSFVVGVVTNNNDQQQMGRVKVKLPALADNHESEWARVIVPSSGNARGVLMLPQVGEEVVVAFENGDPQRPYVVGSVFNGKEKPGEDLLQGRGDGSFAVTSNKKIWMKAAEDIEVKSDKSMLVTLGKDLTEKESGNYTNEATGNTKLKAQQVTIEAGGTLSIKGVSVTVEASASLTLKGSAGVTLQGTGPTSIKGNPISIG
jgi:uncharacterized protein involved in type VI secretion and phage assembly